MQETAGRTETETKLDSLNAKTKHKRVDSKTEMVNFNTAAPSMDEFRLKPIDFINRK